MTPERLRSFFDLWNAHDVDGIVEYFTADGVYMASIGPDDDGTAFKGHTALRQGVAGFFAAYADVSYSDLRMTLSGDVGFATWTLEATAPDGGALRYRGVDVFRFEGDRIALKDAYRKERSAPIA
jgi:ketosteroid isomerase-like protein